MEEKKNEIILFESQGIKLGVNLKDETVWLTQAQMEELFNKDRKQLQHIFKIFIKMKNWRKNQYAHFLSILQKMAKNTQSNSTI